MWTFPNLTLYALHFTPFPLSKKSNITFKIYLFYLKLADIL